MASKITIKEKGMEHLSDDFTITFNDKMDVLYTLSDVLMDVKNISADKKGNLSYQGNIIGTVKSKKPNLKVKDFRQDLYDAVISVHDENTVIPQ